VPEVVDWSTVGVAGDDWIAKSRLYRPGVRHRHLRVGAAVAEESEGGLIYQRVVDGDLLAVVTLRGPDGRVLYLGAQRADAVFPEPFGVSVRARTVPVDPALAAGVNRLLDELGWWGIAELQFIVSTSGTPHLIDLNGRFFGSLALTSATGVDLPSAWVAAARGGTSTPITTPRRMGARYQWLEGDLRRLHDARGTAQGGWRALCYAVGASHSLWSSTDPGPALRHVVSLGGRGIRKAAAR
jgi:predicted ATP-grasp superfamily ATP-dependent carboligase